jgi:hypothetical protein
MGSNPVGDAKLTFESLISSNVLKREVLEWFKMPVFSE